MKFAKENKLSVTGGSDAHFPRELGRGYAISNAETPEELRLEIIRGKTSAGGRLSTPFVHVLTQIAKNTGLLNDN